MPDAPEPPFEGGGGAGFEAELDEEELEEELDPEFEAGLDEADLLTDGRLINPGSTRLAEVPSIRAIVLPRRLTELWTTPMSATTDAYRPEASSNTERAAAMSASIES